MWFECEQLSLSGKRCVTSRKTAAKEISNQLELKQKLTLARTRFRALPSCICFGFLLVCWIVS